MLKIELVKIETYCPKDSADKVRLAIWDAWGWCIGNYHYCAFLSSWKWYFLPMSWANPTIGEIWKIEEVDEVKIEFLCEKEKVKKVVNAIKKSHPYEKVFIWIYEMLNY
jgi:hypothetical protein